MNKVKKVIIKSIISSSTYILQLEDGEYYFLGFRIVGKEGNQVNYQQELQQAIDVIRKHEKNVNVAIVTLLDPAPGSAIIFYAKKDKINENMFINESMTIKSMIESIAQHISLEPIGLNTDKILPLPKVLGSVIYSGYIGQKRYEISSDEIVIADYDIELGEILEPSKLPIGIRSSDVLKHVSIFGSTGSGKSNTAAVLAKELYKKGFDVIILDWHGEYRNLVPEFNVYDKSNYLVLNPVDLDDLSTMDIVEIMGEVLELTEPQKFILFLALEVLNQAKEFNLKFLLQLIANNSDTTYMQRDVRFALSRKLIMLLSGMGEKLISSTNGYTYIDLGEKLKGGNIIDLSFIKNVKLRRLYALLILKFLLEYAMEKRDDNRKMFIIVEEAQNYFTQNNVIINKALQEIRKFNVGICIISQSPSNVDNEVIKNTSIKIIHSIKSNIDKKIIADSLSLDKEKIQILDKLDVGEAILVAPNIRKDIIIKVKKI